jgi:serine/threonine-protein kinase
MAEADSELWMRVSPYLDRALELDPSELESWLTALDSAHPQLAIELRELLALHAANRASGFMERAPLGPDDSLVRERIGPYTIERLLGRGGMGSVWLGRRSDGKFEGFAAIKLLDRRGLGRDAITQIRHEASLLARLSHPHIARLFDAGVRENGQPYLILEYVEGERIDHYCDARKLPLQDRLRLFLDVLNAVAHAHSQLIVHCDLKPSNVLVTADGTVKLLDFGVASLQPQKLQRLQPAMPSDPQALTPGYAAPEQIRGEPLSTAADVYSLGILLHVLVTGTHPYGSTDSTLTQLARATLTGDPVPASERLADASERRRVRGDLDAIIARALDRDPARRYATATEFAADIRAFLDNCPVRARPATGAYVARKFAERHWGGILTALLTLVVLIGATVLTTLQMLEARRQRDFARAQLARAEALNELNFYVLTDAAPGGKPFTVMELLGRAAHLLERQQRNNAIRVSLLTSVGGQYAFQDEDATSLKLLEHAYQLSHEVSDPAARARGACELAYVISKRGSSPRIEALLSEGLNQLPDDADFALDRGFCLARGSDVASNMGQWDLAIRRARDDIGAIKQVPFEHAMAQLNAEMLLAESYRGAGRYSEALLMFRQLWPQLVAAGRDDTTTAITLLNNWGLAEGQAGRPLEAEKLLRRSIELHRAGATDAAVSPMVLTNYAQELHDLHRLDEAQDYAFRAYKAALQAGDEIVVNTSLLRLARIYRDQHDYTRASQMLDEVEPRMRKALPPGHYAFGALLTERALIALGQGDTDRALVLVNQAIDLAQSSAKEGKSSGQVLAQLLMRRAGIEIAAGQGAAAERDAKEALASLSARVPPGELSAATGRGYLTVARALKAEGKDAEARSAALEAVRQLETTVGKDHPDTRAAQALSEGAPAPPS